MAVLSHERGFCLLKKLFATTAHARCVPALVLMFCIIQSAAKNSSLKFFAVFSATVWDFNVKFLRAKAATAFSAS